MIATFNTRNLSSRADRARVDRLSSLLDRYHLIVLEELRDTPVVARVISSLEERTGRDFEAVISERVGSKAHGEFYGFLYDADILDPLPFSGLYYDEDDSYARDPGYQAFRAGGFDFIVVAVHITWGSTVRGRQAEIQELAGVLETIKRRFRSERGQDERDVILLGDFNRPQSDERAFGPLRETGYSPAIPGDVPTTIGDVASYDNFWFKVQETSEYSGAAGVDEFDERLHLPRKRANLLYSDHRPTWAVFNITGRDDD